MDSETAIEVTNLSKKYRLGTIGMTSLREDLSRLWNRKKTVEQPTAPNGTIDAPRKINDHEFWALKDLNFSIRKGEVIGLIGANGSGKSTLLKILSRITEPTKGSVKVRGRVASLLEVGTGFHPELTGRENVYVNGAILGMTRKEVTNKFDEIVDFAGVSDFIDTPIKRYSSGMTVRLGFAVAAHLDPDILIVDEVLAVGDASFQEKCIGKMKNVSSGGKTILLVSHQMPMIESLCQRTILVKQGSISFYGQTTQAISHYSDTTQKNDNSDLEFRQNRTGTGQLIFSGICITSLNGKNIDYVTTGLSFIFKLRFKQNTCLKNLKSEKFCVSINIDNANNQRLAMMSSLTVDYNLNLEQLCRDGLSLCIKEIPLMAGKYSITAFLGNDNLVLDSVNKAFLLRVIESDYYKTGRNQIKGHGDIALKYSYK